jgi:sugar phosphate isomerase/epimerase
MINVNGAEQPLILANMTTLNVSSFRERVEVAAEAGFDALGLSLDEFRRLSTTELTAEEMRATVDGSGIKVLELEAVFGFAVDPEIIKGGFGGGLMYTAPADLDEFWRMADLFGARHLQAVGAFATDVLEDDAVERFADLCDRAAAHGLKVALEFVPTTNVSEAATARRIVEQAGRANGGLCVDSWHHTRGANDLDLLRPLTADQVVMIQIDDGPAEPADPDFLNETLHYRQIPGEGEFDLPGFVAAVTENGASAPVSVEVISDSLRELAPLDGARRMVEGTRRLFA